jgi:hypothetical protein
VVKSSDSIAYFAQGVGYLNMMKVFLVMYIPAAEDFLAG